MIWFFDLIELLSEKYGIVAALIVAGILLVLISRFLDWSEKPVHDGTNPNPPPEAYGCPSCQNEFERHITICPDCDVALVENVKEYLDAS